MFCLATSEKLMKDWPGGLYLFIKSTPRVPGGIPLLTTRYKYNYRKVLGFIVTRGDGSTEPVDIYTSCFSDIYSNVSVRPVIRPRFIGRYFNDLNTIDNHNRMRQPNIAIKIFGNTKWIFWTCNCSDIGYGYYRWESPILLWCF